MVRVTLASLFCVAACGGDDGSGAQVDAPAGPACTGALYDKCTVAADCMSQNCHFYQQSNFTVCTQACSASSPCPVDSTGTPGDCNNMGICKPVAPNNCTP